LFFIEYFGIGLIFAKQKQFKFYLISLRENTEGSA